MKNKIHSIVKKTVIACGLLGITSLSFAKAINYYDQPAPNSKLLGTMETSAGIITIYKPKDTEWIKVADPRNGNVGWVKTTDLNMAGNHLNVITGGDGSHQYQIIQFGNTDANSSDQLSQTLKKLQEKQKVLQQDMQKMMQDMFKDESISSFPIFVPVVIQPEKIIPKTEKKETPEQK